MSTTNCLMAEVRLIRELDRLWFRLAQGCGDQEDGDAYADAKAQIERRLDALDAGIARSDRTATRPLAELVQG